MNLLTTVRPSGLWVAIGLLVFGGCTKWRSAGLPVVSADNEGVISGWCVVGPFYAPPGQKAFDIDFLKQAGTSETSFDVRKYPESKQPVPSGKETRMLKVNGTEIIDFQYLYGLPYADEGRTPESAAYCAVVVKSATAKRIWLMLGSNDGFKVWLNGQPCGGANSQRRLSQYDDEIELSLSEGENVLLLKCINLEGPWAITARIAPTAHAVAAEMARLGTRLLGKMIVAQGEDMPIRLRGFPSTVNVQMQVFAEATGQRIAEVPVAAGNTWTVPSRFPDGFYRATVTVDQSSTSSRFFVGNPEGYYAQLISRRNSLSNANLADENWWALETRAAIVFKDSNRQPADFNWQWRTFFMLDELQRAVTDCIDQKEPFRGKPGLHLRGFTSKIDGLKQCYRIAVPSNYEPGKPLPLAVLLPTLVSASRPFIESPFIAAQGEAERIAALADRAGVAVLWSGYRGRPNGHPFEFPYFDEVMSSVQREYSIDPHRVTLVAACSGGMLGSMMIARWPERFAGFGVLNPVFHRKRNRFDDDPGELAQFALYHKWIDENDPVLDMVKNKQTPLLIIHDGGEPGHGELSMSEEVADLGAAHGMPVQLKREPQTLTQHFAAWEELLNWAATQKKEKPSPRREERLFEANSISRGLCSPILIVRGTSGSAEENARIQLMAEKFMAAWRGTYFGPCPIIDDRAVDEAMQTGHTLVLIGNEKTNALWSKCALNLPVRIHDETIEVDGELFTGDGLGVQAMVPNPAAPDSKLLLIGGCDLLRTDFSVWDLSIDGWYQCAIWRESNGAFKMEEARRLKPQP
jgi:hypothetical protein